MKFGTWSHASLKNHGSTLTIDPHIPPYGSNIPRLCVCPSVHQLFVARGEFAKGDLYVYRTEACAEPAITIEHSERTGEAWINPPHTLEFFTRIPHAITWTVSQEYSESFSTYRSLHKSSLDQLIQNGIKSLIARGRAANLSKAQFEDFLTLNKPSIDAEYEAECEKIQRKLDECFVATQHRTLFKAVRELPQFAPSDEVSEMLANNRDSWQCIANEPNLPATAMVSLAMYDIRAAFSSLQKSIRPLRLSIGSFAGGSR